MQAIRETASNIAASAVSGMEKTKATVTEKMEIMAAQHPMEKQLATQRKEERIAQAERTKLAAQRHNALVRQLSVTGVKASSAAQPPIRTQSLPPLKATPDDMLGNVKPAPASARSAGDTGTNSNQLMADAPPTAEPPPQNTKPEAAEGGAATT